MSAPDVVRVADLVGTHEIAQRAGVSAQAVCNWATRHETFPAPLVSLECGRVWYWPQVAAWLSATGRTRGGE